MKTMWVAFAAATMLSAPTAAQEEAAQPAEAAAVQVAAQAEPARAVLPAFSEVLLRLNQELTSTRNRQGDTFSLAVVQDVTIGEAVVIPKGSRAVGEVSWQTGKGAFGKSSKMEIELLYLDLDGRRLALAAAPARTGPATPARRSAHRSRPG